MKLRKNDIYLILFIACTAAAIFIFNKSINKNELTDNARVRIIVDKKEYALYRLDENTTVEINTAYGYNLLIIEDGYAYISKADCPDGICMSHKKISKANETIVCLPHKLVIEINNGVSSELDAVVN